MGIIYSITNKVNDKRYIGQTCNGIDRRRIEHLSALRNDKHHSIYLQRAWNKYGEESFVFEVLEECSIENLNANEIKWIALYNTISNDCGYNMNKGGCDSSSKLQYRKLMIFDKRSGVLSGVFNTAKECANFIGCHGSTVWNGLLSNTRTACDYYIRDFQEGVQSIDVSLLKEELKLKKVRAGVMGNAKRKRDQNTPDRLLGTEELIPMITGPLDEDNIQTHSIDLNVIKIEKITGSGFIPAKGKTVLAKYEEVALNNNIWTLQPGVYNVEFEQGCNIPSYAMLLIRQRSSLLRNGGIISSSVWDANFETKSMGTVMVLSNPIQIEYRARIATIYGHACEPVKKLYSGQWQNDKQRLEEKSQK